MNIMDWVLTKFLLLVGSLLLIQGCVGESDDGVEFNPSENTGGKRETDDTIDYDTTVDPNASFDFDFTGLPFVGVNMSGPEWDGGARSTNWPNQYLTKGYSSFLKYFRGWGMTTVRLPFRWEYLQPELMGPLDKEELEELKVTVFHLRQYRAKILIDMHNYARYKNELIGSEAVPYAAYKNVWRQLARIFGPYPEVMFGIMNEPYSKHDDPEAVTYDPLPTSQWVTAANAAIAGIRAEGAKNLIFVNGNGWSGAHSWNQTWPDGTQEGERQSNAEAMLEIVDPLGDDHLIFEVHQYLDDWSSDWGTCECNTNEPPAVCTNETVGSYRMQPFTQWLRDNNKKGFLGEFGVEGDATCIAALDDHLQHIKDNDDVYVGWTWWSAGPGCASWQSPIDPYCWGEAALKDLAENGVEGDLVYAQVKTLVKHLNNK